MGHMRWRCNAYLAIVITIVQSFSFCFFSVFCFKGFSNKTDAQKKLEKQGAVRLAFNLGSAGRQPKSKVDREEEA